MDSPILFHGRYPDVLALIDSVESPPRTPISPGDSDDNWDAFTADKAAAHFVGDVLRWYEGLDTSTQESWASLRASLLATFDQHGKVLNDDEDEDDRFTGRRNSCLVAWPSPPPFSLPGFQEAGSNILSEELQPTERSKSMSFGVANGLYSATPQKPMMQRLRTVSRIGRRRPPSTPSHPQLPQSLAVSHFVIDLLETTPKHHRTGWNTIEIGLPPADEARPATFRITEPIPLRSEILNFVRVGFRLAMLPASNETTYIDLRYYNGSSSNRYWVPADWKPDPFSPSKTVFIRLQPYAVFRRDLKPGVLIKLSLVTTSKLTWEDEPAKVVVEWKLS